MQDGPEFFDVSDLVGRLQGDKGERAGLTDTDRDFLANPNQDLSEGTRNVRRHRIRNRIRESLIDGVLFNTLSPKDIKKLFGRLYPDELGKLSEEERLTVAGMIGYVHMWFLGMDHEVFQYVISEGVKRALFRANVLGNKVVPIGMKVRVDIRWEGVAPLDDLESRYKAGEELTREALEGLALDGRIEWDDVEDYDAVTDDSSVLPSTIFEDAIGVE